MKCCVKCFKDSEIKAIINTKKITGNCDFCSNKKVNVYDMESNSELRESFESLLDIYAPIFDSNAKFPKNKVDLLKNILCNQWNIFNLTSDKIYDFLVHLMPDKYSNFPSLFDNGVGITGIVEESYLEEYSILGSYQWEDFVKEIKTQNRFHTDIIKKETLKKILIATSKQYKKGKIFYRARICSDDNGFDLSEMGAPPNNKATTGRANPEGISCLYLADSINTTLHEIRAGVYDYVTVGEFELLEDIDVVNLTYIDKISPFQGVSSELIAVNLEHLEKIGNEISKPLRRHDSPLDYLPTQYISDYIKKLGYDGIEYQSTMFKNGINYAVFNQKLFKCIKKFVYDIESLKYEYNICENQ